MCIILSMSQETACKIGEQNLNRNVGVILKKEWHFAFVCVVTIS